MQKDPEINVLGAALAACSQDPVTGFFRDGHCNTCEADHGSHTVCAVMTASSWPIQNILAMILARRGRNMAL